MHGDTVVKCILTEIVVKAWMPVLVDLREALGGTEPLANNYT